MNFSGIEMLAPLCFLNAKNASLTSYHRCSSLFFESDIILFSFILDLFLHQQVLTSMAEKYLIYLEDFLGQQPNSTSPVCSSAWAQTMKPSAHLSSCLSWCDFDL